MANEKVIVNTEMKEELEERIKVYVQVAADFYPDGRMRPSAITMPDGKKYYIDEIKDIRRAKILTDTMSAIRYSCSIWGKVCYLYYEENYKWFVEIKVQKREVA